MDDTQTAKKYLQERPFKIVYFIRRNADNTTIKEIYSEEYPDHIPKREDMINFEDCQGTLVVSNSVFHPDRNIIEILVEDSEEYFDQYKKEVNRYMRKK